VGHIRRETAVAVAMAKTIPADQSMSWDNTKAARDWVNHNSIKDVIQYCPELTHGPSFQLVTSEPIVL
jgi:hypothetical protein